MKNLEETLSEILDELGEAYHNNYPDNKALKSAKQELIKHFKGMMEEVIDTRMGGITTPEQTAALLQLREKQRAKLDKLEEKL